MRALPPAEASRLALVGGAGACGARWQQGAVLYVSQSRGALQARSSGAAVVSAQRSPGRHADRYTIADTRRPVVLAPRMDMRLANIAPQKALLAASLLLYLGSLLFPAVEYDAMSSRPQPAAAID